MSKTDHRALPEITILKAKDRVTVATTEGDQAYLDKSMELKNLAQSMIDAGLLESILPEGDATLNINSALFDTISSGGTLNLEVRQSTGAITVGSPDGTYWRIGVSNISNSDGSYDIDVEAEDDLVLPNQSIEVNSVVEGTIPSVGTIDINITDGTSPVTPDSVVIAGRVVTIAVPDCPPSGGGDPVALPAPTNSETDEGTAVNAYVPGTFHNLPYNNPFGHNARRTGTAGGYYDYNTSQYKLVDGTVSDRAGAFPGPRFIDWLQWDQAAGKVMMYQILGNSIYIYADIITFINGMSNGGYTDWFLPSLDMYYAQVRKGGTTRGMGYAPIDDFGGDGTGLFWTSTTGFGGTDKMVISNGGSTISNRDPAQAGRSMLAGRWADVSTDITI